MPQKRKRYIYIDSANARELLERFAKQDAQKQPNGKPNITATLYDILLAEGVRRASIAAAQTAEEPKP